MSPKFSIKFSILVCSGIALLFTSLPGQAQSPATPAPSPAASAAASNSDGASEPAVTAEPTAAPTATPTVEAQNQTGQEKSEKPELQEAQPVPESQAAPEKPTEKTAENPEELDVLAPLKEDLNAPKSSVIELPTTKDKKKFNRLESEDPKDYLRTSGIWISDTGNGRIIYMKDFDGNDFYTVGISGHGLGRFLKPEQIWVDIEGKIYVADRGNNRIVRMDDVRGLGWTEMTGFTEPQGVAFHGKRLFVSDTGANRILVYDKFGATEPMATLSDPKLQAPGYLWLDMEGNLYVSCGEYPPGGSVVRIPYNLTTPSSQWTVYRGNGLDGNKFSPTQLIANDSGMFVIDSMAMRVVRVDNMSGRDSWELGGYGSRIGQFLDPKGLSQDEEGHIYIADTGNDRIVRIDNIRGQGWTTYETFEPTFGLRGPRSIFVWSPRPAKEEVSESEDDQDKEKDKDKDKEKEEKKAEDIKVNNSSSQTDAAK